MNFINFIALKDMIFATHLPYYESDELFTREKNKHNQSTSEMRDDKNFLNENKNYTLLSYDADYEIFIREEMKLLFQETQEKTNEDEDNNEVIFVDNLSSSVCESILDCKNEIISILKNLNEDKLYFETSLIESLFELILEVSIESALNPFLKFISFVEWKRTKIMQNNTFLKLEYSKYSDFLNVFMTIILNEDIINAFSLQLETRALNILKKQKIKGDDVIYFLNRLIYFFKDLQGKMISQIYFFLKRIQVYDNIFVYAPGTNENISYKIITEILYWFEGSHIFFFCASEINLMKRGYIELPEIEQKSFATVLTYLYYYTLKAFLPFGLIKLKDKKYAENIRYLEYREFLKKLLLFRFKLVAIIEKFFDIYENHLTFYNVTNFLLFTRLYSDFKMLLIKNLDLWIINEVVTEEKLVEYEKIQDVIFKHANYNSLNDKQKKIYMVFLIKDKLENRKCGKYTKMIDKSCKFCI